MRRFKKSFEKFCSLKLHSELKERTWTKAASRVSRYFSLQSRKRAEWCLIASSWIHGSAEEPSVVKWLCRKFKCFRTKFAGSSMSEAVCLRLARVCAVSVARVLACSRSFGWKSCVKQVTNAEELTVCSLIQRLQDSGREFSWLGGESSSKAFNDSARSSSNSLTTKE